MYRGVHARGILMNKLAFGLVGAAALCVSFCGAASAADMAVKAVPPVPPVVAPTWTGFYVGGNVGAGWTTPSTDFLGTFSNSARASKTGFLGGVQGGYNYQWNVVVLGIEANVDWSDVSMPFSCFNCTGKIQAFGDVAGRFGVAVDRALFYLKGGWALAEMKVTSPAYTQVLFNGPFFGPSLFSIGGGSANAWRNGAVLGAGVEYAFLPNWSAEIEYDYYDFLNQQISIPVTFGGVPGTVKASSGLTEQTVKFGVNYRFGGF
jgi:outer membrane immunogenic protein